MLIPWNTTSVYTHTPYANWGIIAVTSLVSFWGFTVPADSSGSVLIQSLILNGWNPVGMVGYTFLHAGFFHLLGNMIFLWVFGNVVCSKTGSLSYLLVYIACGMGAAVGHLLLSADPVIGASGAVNGIVGFYLVLQPTNQVEMLFIWFLRIRRFSLSGYWVIIYWLLWDIYGLISEGAGVAYGAHVGGFITGLLLGSAFVLFRWLDLDECDTPTLLEHFGFLPKGYAGGFEAGNHSGNQLRRKGKKMRHQENRSGATEVAEQGAAETHEPALHSDSQPQAAPLSPLAPLPDENDDVTILDCPHCGEPLALRMDQAGTEMTCPGCRKRIRIEAE